MDSVRYVRSRLSDLRNRQAESDESTISLLASASHVPEAVYASGAVEFSRITNEGFPGARYHPAALVADEIEHLAREQAKISFNCGYANVQPHSATNANNSVLTEFLKPGDRLLSMSLREGGHLSHGAAPAFGGKHFNVSQYGLVDGKLEIDAIRSAALREEPKLIIVGASSYPLAIDFDAFAKVAAEVEAVLLADISHIAGLVAAGLHQSPIGLANFTTTSLYKQLFGPRGGLILSNDISIEERLDRSVFPGTQGTPDFASIAAKATALSLVQTGWFRSTMSRALNIASTLASKLQQLGVRLTSGGTQTTTLLIDLSGLSRSGKDVEEALESVGILANRNLVPGDTSHPLDANGVRIGSLGLSLREFDDSGVSVLASVISTIVDGPTRTTRKDLRALGAQVGELARQYPQKGMPRL